MKNFPMHINKLFFDFKPFICASFVGTTLDYETISLHGFWGEIGWLGGFFFLHVLWWLYGLFSALFCSGELSGPISHTCGGRFFGKLELDNGEVASITTVTCNTTD